MAPEQLMDEHKATAKKPIEARPGEMHDGGEAPLPMAVLQQTVGNRAVQRLIAQRSADGPSELDDETAGRIDQERGGGQPLDSAVQAKMGAATGHDFSGVNVHTSPESDQLNRQLGAKAFTTGQDIFFRDGAYDPGSSSGQELLAHELTHVVQQRSGSVGGGGGRMTVNAPGDVHEQEAEATSKAVMSGSAEVGVQRQAAEEEEEEVQKQAAEEEEEQVQTQAEEEEEEPTA